MKKNTAKILMAVLSLIMALGIATGTTFAWFSLNNKVTVTGMNVTTKVSNSILIAASTTDATAKAADSAFKTNYVAHSETLLEPVSTVDGNTFFYNASTNVQASGDAIADSYIAYAEGDTFDQNYGVDSTASTADAKGYVDYAFQLKVTNTDPSANAYVNLTQCNLTYNGAATSEKAFRVAVFVSDMGADGSTAAAVPGTLLTILRPSGAAYFTSDSAVANTTTISAVDTKIDDQAIIGTVSAQSTHFYKVVVRLWLEGEDNTCNNTTFATLTSNWALDLAVELEAADTNAVANLNKANLEESKVELNDASLAAASSDITIDGVAYHLITGKTLDSKPLYTDSATLSASSHIFTIDAATSQYVTDVTLWTKYTPAP